MKILAIFLSVLFALLQFIVGIFGSFANAVLSQVGNIDSNDKSDDQTFSDHALGDFNSLPNVDDYQDSNIYGAALSQHLNSFDD